MRNSLSSDPSGVMSVMNKKQRKDLLVALGILVGIVVVLSLVAALSG